MYQHLCVGVSGKTMSLLLELLPQVWEVVNFPIADDPDGAILVRDRLVTPGKVNNAEPAHTNGYRASDVLALIIWSPMGDHCPHGFEHARGCGVISKI